MPETSVPALIILLGILSSIVGTWIWVIVRLALQLPVLPPATPRIVPWGAGTVLAAILCWIVLSSAVALAYSATIPVVVGPDGQKSRRDLTPGEIMTISAVQNAATLAIVPLLLAAIAGARPRDLGIVGEGFAKNLARGVVGYPLLAPLVFAVMGLSIYFLGRNNHPLQDAITQNMGPGLAAVLVLAGVILAPAAEELIFRGILLGWLTRLALLGASSKRPDPTSASLATFPELEPVPAGHLLETVEIDLPEPSPDLGSLATAEHPAYSPSSGIAAVAPRSPRAIGGRLLAANVIVSLVFATLHGKVWPTPMPIFFLSLGLGFLYQRTGGIVASTALHMTFNGMSTLVMFVTLGAVPTPKAPPATPTPPTAISVFSPGH